MIDIAKIFAFFVFLWAVVVPVVMAVFAVGIFAAVMVLTWFFSIHPTGGY